MTSPTMQKLVTREVEETPVARRFISDTGESRAMVYLKSTNSALVDGLRQKVKEICQGQCFLTGDVVAFSDFSQQFISTLFESFFLSLLLVSVVIAFLVQATGTRRLPVLLVSSFWGPVALLACFEIFGIEVNSVTCVVASTIVGLTGDNAIQFLFSGKKNLIVGLEHMGGGSVQCSLVMGMASLAFLGSYFQPPRVLALLLFGGLLLSLFGDVFIFRTLLKRNQPLASNGPATG